MRLLYALILCALLPGQSMAQADDMLARGEYIFQLANCYGCHTDVENDGPALAGGRALESDFGTFYSPNITPHRETGIGNWSLEEFSNAVRQGRAPDGNHYFPAFPFTAYKNISDEDINALKTYLFSQPAVERVNKPHQLSAYVKRIFMPIWNSINNFLAPADAMHTSRGAYVLNTLGHCQECHTPRNSLGMLKHELAFAGNEVMSAPSLQNTSEGIGEWSDEELLELFSDGILADGDYVSDHMAEVVDFSTSKWNPDDRKAVVEYLRQQ